MNVLTQLTLATLKPLEKILRKKNALLNKVRTLDRQLESLGGSIGGMTSGSQGGPNRHGALKEKIIHALQKAGKQGLHIKELAQQVDTKVPNVRVWFHSTGKKLRNEIKQIGRATYAWTGAGKTRGTTVAAGTKRKSSRRRRKTKLEAKSVRKPAYKTRAKIKIHPGRRGKRATSVGSHPADAMPAGAL